MARVKKVSTLKKKADAIFSKYVRLRDSEDGIEAHCITCGVRKPIKELQAGHFISRRVNALRFDDENVNVQCLTEESNLRMFNGQHKSIAYIKEGDELWAFNEATHELERARVQHVRSFMPKELYEVELEDGSKFYATPDHRVVANGEWVEIKDMLHDPSTYNILEL